MIAVGLVMLVISDPIITLIGFDAVDDVWIRLFGWMLASGGYLYVQVGRTGNEEFALATLHVRFPVVVVHVVLFLLELAPPMLITFGAVDLLGAVWTAAALRRDNS